MADTDAVQEENITVSADISNDNPGLSLTQMPINQYVTMCIQRELEGLNTFFSDQIQSLYNVQPPQGNTFPVISASGTNNTGARAVPNIPQVLLDQPSVAPR